MKRFKVFMFMLISVFCFLGCNQDNTNEVMAATNKELSDKIDIVAEMVENQNSYQNKWEEEIKQRKLLEEEQAFKTENFIEIEKFHFPLPEEYKNNITSYSGYRDNNKLNTGGVELHSNMHYGIDYGCPDKTPVYAAKDGYVETVYPGFYNGSVWKGDRVYGGMIIIHHSDGTSTLYGHLSYTEVREGYHVKAGDEIGWSGGVRGRRASGASSGPHLHFAMYYDLENMFF